MHFTVAPELFLEIVPDWYEFYVNHRFVYATHLQSKRKKIKRIQQSNWCSKKHTLKSFFYVKK